MTFEDPTTMISTLEQAADEVLQEWNEKNGPARMASLRENVERAYFAGSCGGFRHRLLRGGGRSELRIVVTSYHATNQMFGREADVSIPDRSGLTINLALHTNYPRLGSTEAMSAKFLHPHGNGGLFIPFDAFIQFLGDHRLADAVAEAKKHVDWVDNAPQDF